VFSSSFVEPVADRYFPFHPFPIDSEKEKKQVPIAIRYVSASPTGSVAAVLNTTPLATQDGAFVYGRDLMVWGSNSSSFFLIFFSLSILLIFLFSNTFIFPSFFLAVDAQLGNGRRSNLPVPQYLPSLPTASSPSQILPLVPVPSGTTSPMPHHRLQLAQAVVELRDLQGKKVKGKQSVEQVCSFGYGGGAVYWKVI